MEITNQLSPTKKELRTVKTTQPGLRSKETKAVLLLALPLPEKEQDQFGQN